MVAVVIGGSGQIGGWLLRALAARGHEAIGTYATVPTPALEHLDASRQAEAAAWLRDREPDLVFYPAGFTWVDGCERDPDKARASNRDEPLNLARVVAELGGRFVTFSTDYLFDGEAGPYDEDATPRPLSVYGRAKLEAELALGERLGDRLLILRTCWVFGPERQAKNFAYQAVRALKAGKPLVCPADQWSSPSYAPDVARAAVTLADRGESGVWHLAGPDWIDRPTFAGAIARTFDLDPGLIVARPTAELGQAAPRPRRGGLRSNRLPVDDPIHPRPLADALADFVDQLREPSYGWADPTAP